MKNIILLFLMCFTISTFAQQDKSQILSKTKVVELQQYADNLSSNYWTTHKQAIKIAKLNGWDTTNLITIGTNGQPLYGGDYNNIALSTTNTIELHGGGSLNIDLGGNGFNIGQWESGIALGNHYNLGNGVDSKINVMDGATILKNHATHVAGTLVGDGTNSGNAKGMAHEAEINAYNHDDEASEVAAEASSGLLVSNHSWGYWAGWHLISSKWIWYGGAATYNSAGEDANHGRYSQFDRTIDSVLFLAPSYLMVRAAGNENNDNPAVGDSVQLRGSSTTSNYNTALHPPGDAAGGDNIPFAALGKNILTVGAIDGNNGNQISTFSSQGPIDDGRIKPDIVGHGVSLYSSGVDSNDHYYFSSGTSMATPNVTGSALLLQEYYEDLHGSGSFMNSATLKAVMLHTAQDLGNPGPDYTFGWGLLDTEGAANLLKDEDDNNGVSIFENTQYATVNQYGVLSSCAEDVVITIAYTDRPGIVQTTLDNTTPNLVNDLDLRLIDQTTTAFPWILNPAAPGNNATTGDNDVDNIEQIISTANKNLQIAQMSVEGSLTGGSQDYSIIFENIEELCTVLLSNQGTGTLAEDASYCSTADFTTRATIPSGRTIKYTNPDRIVLLPGFSAVAGSDVLAHITAPCN